MRKHDVAAAAVLGSLLALGQAHAQEAGTFEEFQRIIEEGTEQDQEARRQRAEEFSNSSADERQRLLEQAQADLAALEARSTDLENTFDENELLIQNVRGQLQQQLGPLNELFGVLQQVAGEANIRFRNSLTSIEFPERTDFLADFAAKLGETDRLPNVTEIERLWFELLREATELGKVKRLPEQRYVTANGQEMNAEVVRVGPFNVATDGAYLQYNPDSGSISELQRQPESRFVESTSALLDAQPGDGPTRFGVDTRHGTVLANLADTATWLDQVEQGGLPGYVIIALGILAVLMSLERFVMLGIARRNVKAQLKRDTPSSDNPLGRVLKVYEENKNVDTETLELKLSEAILAETPALQRGILFIKIISVVAPLLGLLGTVMGMIETFQSITLFGTGDPSIMADGISQALVTTEFGLIVAVPTVLLHTIVSNQSRSVTQVLQERSTGLVAEHAKNTRAPRAA